MCYISDEEADILNKKIKINKRQNYKKKNDSEV